MKKYIKKNLEISQSLLILSMIIGTGLVVLPQEAIAAVAHDAASESHTGTTGSASQASFTWNHTSTNPEGVVVFVTTISATDTVTSVTYGGVTMTEITAAAVIDTATEPGRIDVFFLGSGVPTGTQAIVVNRTNNAVVMYATAATVQAATATEIHQAGIVKLQEDGAIAQQNVTDGSSGVNSVRYAAAYTGAAAPATAGANSTLLHSIDLGAFGTSNVRETTAGQGSRPIGLVAASDDRAATHFAIRELVVSTTLGDGTDPSNSTIAPGASATEIDRFSLVTNTGTDTVTGLTVTLGPANAFNNIATVDVQTTGGVSKCSATPSSNTVSLTGCAIAVTTSSTEYKIMITPKTHANMAAPATGASYATVATVTAFTSTNAQAGTDTDSATITVDNLSPANVTSATVAAGDGETTISWTNPVDSDFDEVYVLRHTSAVSDTPTEGTEYATSTTVGSATVVCRGNRTSCTDSGLSNGTAYHYKIFAQDSRVNYSDAGVVPTGSPATPAESIISFVGSAKSSSSGTTDTTVDLSSMGLVAGDLVMVAGGIADGPVDTDYDMIINTTGYTEVADVWANATLYESNFGVWWKIMGATPDTSVVVEGSPGGTDSSIAVVAMAFRGVDAATPMDVTPTTATNTNGAGPNPPSLNHNNPTGVWTVIAGMQTHVGGDTYTFTFPTGYTANKVDRSHNNTTDLTIGMGYRSSGISDPEDPGVMTPSGAIATNSSWVGATIALRPSPPTTTLGDGTDPSNSTIGPNAAGEVDSAEIDRFTFIASGGTDTVTDLEITLGPANAFNNIASVAVETAAGASKCSATPSSNTVSLTGCAIGVTTGSTEYKIMITPKTHPNMAAPATGASYDVTATVTNWTGTNTHAGTDTDSAVITVDNLSPANVTSAAVTAGDGTNTISWTNPADYDFEEIYVLRHTSAVSDTPTEGTEYATSTTVGSATVVCRGNRTSCTDSSLSNGTAYHYKIFAQDSRINYSDAGVVPTGSPATPNATITVSAIGTQTSTISIPGTDKFVGGAFRLTRSSGSTNVTSIGVTVNSSTGLSGVQIYTDTAASCNTADPIATATLFNSSPGTFSSNKATVTGTLSVTTAIHCLYVVLDVSSSAADSQTLDLTINAGSDITAAAGLVGGTFPVAISGSTTLRKPTFDLVKYRFFENNNGTSVVTPIGEQDIPQTLSTTGQTFRLRLLMRVSTADMIASSYDFKLQYVAKGASCNVGGVWADVTTNTPIAYNDNSNVSDGAALTANASDDPTDSVLIVNQTYEEANNFTNSQGVIAVGEDGKWDFSLKDNSAPAGTTYCLRVVTSAGIAITYTIQPEITTAIGGTPDLQQLHFRWREDNGSETAATWAAAEDAALNSGVFIGDRRRLRFLVSNAGTGAAADIAYRLEHASTSCSAWLAVPTLGSSGAPHWVMDFSNFLIDGIPTSDSAGLTNPGGKSFVTGFAKVSGNQGSNHGLTNSQFTELEFSVRSTSYATAGTTYCFRLTNAGSTTNFTYTQQPQIVLSAIAHRPSGGGGNSGAGGEGSGSGSQQGGGGASGGTGPTGGEGSGGGENPPPQGGGGSGGGGGDTGYIDKWNNLASPYSAVMKIMEETTEMIKSFIRNR